MTDPSEYVPPKVWTWNRPSSGTFASMNRPISGATHEMALPVGRHPLQLYSMGTPNGVKITVMLEELLALGHRGAEFLSLQDYQHVQRWADLLLERPAVRRGRMVNRTSGEPSSPLRERHDAHDFETSTADKRVPGG